MIDPTTFVTQGTVWRDIHTHLKNAGYDVYSPGTKLGECTSEYLVVKNNGSTRHSQYSTDQDFYSVMCYVPKQKYSDLEALVQRVKATMKDLMPMVRPYGTQSASYYDDTYKAHMVSIEYVNYKKI